MDRFKHERFAREHPEHGSLILESLSDSESTVLRERLAFRLGLAKGTDPLVLVKAVSSRSVPVPKVDAKSANFRLDQVFWAAQLKPPMTVLVNWYRFDRIDRGKTDELTRFFRDVWYPDSDDIDLFDESCEWIVSVAHSGKVSLAKLGMAQLRFGGT